MTFKFKRTKRRFSEVSNQENLDGYYQYDGSMLIYNKTNQTPYENNY